MARHYKPAIDRMSSIDPVLGTLENPQSWNRYAYVHNNPLGSIDPTGRESFQIYLDGQIEGFLENGTEPYFHDETLQNTALFGMALLSPIPGDEVEVAAMIVPKAAARAGGFLGKESEMSTGLK